MALMELDVERLLEELGVALRALCSDPDLAVLLYQPALADGAPVLSTTSSGDIPEFASPEAAQQFVDDKLGGARGPLEPRQLQSENGYSILLDIPFSLLASRQETLAPETDRRRYAPPPLLRRMVQAGLLGRKSGRGFYDHSQQPPVPVVL